MGQQMGNVWQNIQKAWQYAEHAVSSKKREGKKSRVREEKYLKVACVY